MVVIKMETCYTIHCDSPGCGGRLEYDYEPHWPSPEVAREEAVQANEWWSDGATDLCESCRSKPHAFMPDPDSAKDCGRCRNPADEHEEATQ